MVGGCALVDVLADKTDFRADKTNVLADKTNVLADMTDVLADQTSVPADTLKTRQASLQTPCRQDFHSFILDAHISGQREVEVGAPSKRALKHRCPF